MAQYTKKEEIALQIINLAKAEILSRNHFLGTAVGRLLTEPVSLGKSLAASNTSAQFTTDGERLGFDAGTIIRRFSGTKGEAPTHDLMHTVIHCTFLHPFIGKKVDPDLWNLACDIAAERVVAEILGPRSDGRSTVQAKAIDLIEADMGGRADAERIYAGLNAGKWRNRVPFWEMLFFSDEHGTWYLPPDVTSGMGEGESEKGLGADHADVRGPESGNSEKRRGQGKPPKPADPKRRPDSNDAGDNAQSTNPDDDTREPSAGANEETLRESSAEEAPQRDSNEGNATPDRPAEEPEHRDPSKTYSGSGDVHPKAHRASKDPVPQGAGDAHSLNDDADSPGEQPSSGTPEVRSQGEGAGINAESYVSNRLGLGLAPLSLRRAEKLRREWSDVATTLSVNLETYAEDYQSALSGFMSDLDSAAAPPLDYHDFLRQFAALGEVMRLSDDDFDNVFYTYGMRLYGNVPLIEPLETREEKRIREFAIVIDTSGSVRGNVVRAFVDTTFDILKNTECFHEHVNLRILQCDAAVQSDDKIESFDDVEAWGRSMRIFGGGGTDFRPAFEYIDALIAQGEFKNLGGVVYFTDGWGTYPDWCPPYNTAFVFYDDNHRRANVPPWAISAVLDSASIEAAAQKAPVERGVARVSSSRDTTTPESNAAQQAPVRILDQEKRATAKTSNQPRQVPTQRPVPTTPPPAPQRKEPR